MHENIGFNLIYLPLIMLTSAPVLFMTKQVLTEGQVARALSTVAFSPIVFPPNK